MLKYTLGTRKQATVPDIVTDESADRMASVLSPRIMPMTSQQPQRRQPIYDPVTRNKDTKRSCPVPEKSMIRSLFHPTSSPAISRVYPGCS